MASLLHLISSDQRRGAETFAVELADELRSKGHEVSVLAVGHSPDGPHFDVEVAGRSRVDPRGLARIVGAARRCDLVISFGSSSLQSAAVASLLARRPFVYRNIGDPRVWQSVRCADLRVGAPLRRASAIVAVFPDAGTELQHRYRIDGDRIQVIPRGVPADRFPVTTDERRALARRALGLDERPWAIFVGALSPEKDPLLAVEAVTKTASVGLIVCGDGPLANEVRSTGLLPADRMRFLGPVADVRSALAAADVLVLTSITEGVPGVVIEAGLTGLPTVATRVGGLSFVVDDGATGWLVERRSDQLANAIEAAVRRRHDVGAAAAQRCRDAFSMEVVATEWNRVINRVTTGAP